jgi:putative holliday junction resolvase
MTAEMTDIKKPFAAFGFDYGKKTTGLAVGQSLTGTASELPVIRFGETRQSQRVQWELLKKLVQEWKPAVLVVGWPLNMDGTESVFCAEVKNFAEKLHKQTGCLVAFMDERLTSREAKMDSTKKTSDYRKNPVDSYAAKLMLESWFRENV